MQSQLPYTNINNNNYVDQLSEPQQRSTANRPNPNGLSPTPQQEYANNNYRSPVSGQQPQFVQGQNPNIIAARPTVPIQQQQQQSSNGIRPNQPTAIVRNPQSQPAQAFNQNLQQVRQPLQQQQQQQPIPRSNHNPPTIRPELVPQSRQPHQQQSQQHFDNSLQERQQRQFNSMQSPVQQNYRAPPQAPQVLPPQHAQNQPAPPQQQQQQQQQFRPQQQVPMPAPVSTGGVVPTHQNSHQSAARQIANQQSVEINREKTFTTSKDPSLEDDDEDVVVGRMSTPQTKPMPVSVAKSDSRPTSGAAANMRENSNSNSNLKSQQQQPPTQQKQQLHQQQMQPSVPSAPPQVAARDNSNRVNLSRPPSVVEKSMSPSPEPIRPGNNHQQSQQQQQNLQQSQANSNLTHQRQPQPAAQAPPPQQQPKRQQSTQQINKENSGNYDDFVRDEINSDDRHEKVQKPSNGIKQQAPQSAADNNHMPSKKSQNQVNEKVVTQPSAARQQSLQRGGSTTLEPQQPQQQQQQRAQLNQVEQLNGKKKPDHNQQPQRHPDNEVQQESQPRRTNAKQLDLKKLSSKKKMRCC